MDVLANLVTSSQLENWMTHSTGTDRANQDTWCYALAQILGTPCPAYDIGNGPNVLTSATDFLTGLRNFELGFNASNPGPGGSSTPAGALNAPVPGTTSTAVATSGMGQGLFGPTNCQFCIWLKQNPWALAAIAVAIYFAFFYKK